MLYIGDAVSTLPPGSPVTSWPNTGVLGSTFGAIGGGTPLPKFSKDLTPVGMFVTFSPTSYMSVPGSLPWSFLSPGGCFACVAVVRIQKLPQAAFVLAEFSGDGGSSSSGGSPPMAGGVSGLIAFNVDPAGQLLARINNGTTSVGSAATSVPGGVVKPGVWAVVAVRIAVEPAGGHSITLMKNGVVVARSTGAARPSNRNTTVNYINRTAIGAPGGGGGQVDVGRLYVFNSGISQVQLVAGGKALSTGM